MCDPEAESIEEWSHEAELPADRGTESGGSGPFSFLEDIFDVFGLDIFGGLSAILTIIVLILICCCLKKCGCFSLCCICCRSKQKASKG